jgi:hypothetical protein
MPQRAGIVHRRGVKPLERVTFAKLEGAVART